MDASLSVRRICRAAVPLVTILLTASPARADFTAFLGATTTPNNRLTKGLALSTSLVIVGFEAEYADTSENDDPVSPGPGLKMGTGNVFLQTPVEIAGFQPYVTVGAGVYHETLGPESDTGLAVNTGAGVKIALIGPLRLRVDYRVFKLGSGAPYSPAHRIYAGLNVKF